MLKNETRFKEIRQIPTFISDKSNLVTEAAEHVRQCQGLKENQPDSILSCA